MAAGKTVKKVALGPEQLKELQRAKVQREEKLYQEKRDRAYRKLARESCICDLRDCKIGGLYRLVSVYISPIKASIQYYDGSVMREPEFLARYDVTMKAKTPFVPLGWCMNDRHGELMHIMWVGGIGWISIRGNGMAQRVRK